MKYPKMLRELLLIEMPKEVDKKDGVYLPDEVKEKQQEEKRMAGLEGKVVAAGKDVQEVKVGDTVIPKGYVGNTLDVENDKYFYVVISENDIMAVR